MINPSSKRKANILIVDDQPENLKVLSELLTKEGYDVRQAINGQVALKTIQKGLPDLILLDVLMPEMNGYQVCEHLKGDEQTRNIPVIFITVLDEVSNKVDGFKAGGVDYITKPFQNEEVLARVETHLRLRQTQKQLELSLQEKDALLQDLNGVNKELLQKNEEQQAIFNAFPDFYFWLESDGTITGYQTGQVTNLYVPPETFMGKRMQDVLPREVADQFSDAVQQINRGMLSVSIEYMLPVYVEEKYFEARVFPMPEDKIIVIVRDITERKQAEYAMKASEKRLRLLVNASPFPVAVADTADEKILYWSQSAKDMFGHCPKTVSEWYALAYPDPHYRQDVINRWKTLLESTQHSEAAVNAGEYRIVCRDGSVKTCELYAQLIPGNLVVTFHDFTERKQTEESLQRIKWLLTRKPDSNSKEDIPSQSYGDLTVFNTSGEILSSVGHDVLHNIAEDYLSLMGTSSAIYEKDGHYAFGIFSSGWCRFLDHASRRLCNTEDNLEALNSGCWLCHESCWTNASQTAIETGKPVDIECHGGLHMYTVPIITGIDIVGAMNFGYGDPPISSEKLKEIADKYHVSADELAKQAQKYESRPHYIIELAKKRIQTSAKLIAEIVERKRAEQKLQQYSLNLEHMVEERTAELKKAQEELLVKERLAVLGHFAGSISHELRNPLAVIDCAVYLLNMKLKNADDKIHSCLGKISNNVKKSTDIIQSLLSLSKMEKPKTIETDIGELVSEALGSSKIPETVEVVSDMPDEPVFVAVDPEQIRMALKNIVKNAVQAMEKSGKITISAHSVERRVEIAVADTGPGIPPEYLAKVFEPLFSTKTHGIGFGLSITEMIIENHGGTIRAESEPGNGTQFVISLPQSERKRQP